LKKTFVWCIALLLLAPALFAQAWRGNNRLAGSVVDQKTGAPVKNAKVTLRIQKGGSGGPELTTDEKGKWSVLGIAAGGWDLDVNAEGYVTKKLSVGLHENERLPPMKIELEPAAAPQPAAAAAADEASEQVSIGGTTVTKEVAAAVEAGNGFLKNKQFKEAVEQYEKAYPALSANPALKVALARAYYGSGDLKKSIALLDEAYKADPANVGNAMLLAQLSLEDGQLDKGKQILEALPASALTDPTAFVNVGILLMNKKQPAAAREYFSKAITIAPNAVEGYYYRGLAAIQMGKAQEAKPDLQKVLAIAPDGPEAKDAREYLKSIK
jgi:tetratricopeptide (TPR) repeat protein